MIEAKYIVCDDYDLSGKPILMTGSGVIAFAKDKEGASRGYGNTVIDEEKLFERFDDIPTVLKILIIFADTSILS